VEHDRDSITQHAWDRFLERWEGRRPACWRKELYRLIQASVFEDLGYGQVVRLINHGYQPAAYFTAEGWRFVVDKTSGVLLTCERPYKRAKARTYKGINRKRCGQ
jgi:hypothetical protein